MLKKGEIQSLRDIILKKCDEYSERVAFLVKNNITKKFEEITYEKVKMDTTALATALMSKYKLTGEKIAVIGENSYKWYISYMAATTGTGVVVPLDKELPLNEIENLLNRSKAKCVIYSSKKQDVIFGVKQKVSKDIIYIDMDKENSDDESYALSDIIAEGKALVDAGDRTYFDSVIDIEEFRILLFTSGTTANSKGVMLCHKNVISNLDGAIDLMPITAEDRFFSVLPMHHIYESIVTYIYGTANGASIVICSNIKNVGNEIKQTSPTILVTVPLLLEHVLNKIDKKIKDQGKENLVRKMVNVTNKLGDFGYKLKRRVFKEVHSSLGGKLKYVLVSAAPVSKELIDSFEGFGFKILQGYGLSETAPVVSGTKFNNRKAGTVGTASNCEVKINNPDDKGVGEILVKGNNVMLGYYEDEEGTNDVIVDGWFHTGDLGRFDEEGNLIISGRCKSVIVTPNGKNIYPEELENEINKFHLIKESLVYGDETGDDTILSAVVTLNENAINEEFGEAEPDYKKIKDIISAQLKELNKRMVSYKAIRNIKIRTTDFTKTTTMKIKRFLENNKKEE